MVKGSKNQLANVGNKFQTTEKKVLTVCSAGLLRSPTLSLALYENWGYNTRAAGSCKDFALIPITQALIWWADKIVFVDRQSYLNLSQQEYDEINQVGCKVTILNIPDDYDWGDEDLIKVCIEQYENSKESKYDK